MWYDFGEVDEDTDMLVELVKRDKTATRNAGRVIYRPVESDRLRELIDKYGETRSSGNRRIW